MRRSEDMPLDPFEAAELEAIEAALAGREVGGEHAELAELAVLLATDGHYPSEEFARELDARVAGRFSRRPAEGETGSSRANASTRLRSWIWRPAFGAGLTAFMAGAVVLLALQLNGPTASHQPGVGSSNQPAERDLKPAAGASRPAPTVPSVVGGPATSGRHALPFGTNSSSNAPAAASGSSSGKSAIATPAPVPNGRREVQSAQLTLGTAGNRIDAVAQEVFNVVSRENGIVKGSQVTQGGQAGGGYANFNLSVPTGNLQNTLDQLSQLQYAHVVSRTDATQDVNNQFLSDQRQLADARALRTSLLKQLATAFTTAEIDSLKAQIHDAEASISSDEATLHSLQHRISFSSLSVQVNQGVIVVPSRRHASAGSGGLTLGNAAHDAGKVLIVAAGVILIGLAALVPVGLLVALVTWIVMWLRRRQRDQALDAA